MILPSVPLHERANELQVAADYRAESEAFFAAAREPGRSADEAADLRGSGADLRALATSIERKVRGIPGLPPAGLVGVLVALVLAALLTSVAPAQAHTYTHWQWGQSGCFPGVWWAFGDQQEWPSPASQSGNASIARHNRAYHYGPTAQTFYTEGSMEEQYYYRGSECGGLGRVDGAKQQWIDSGQYLVHRQAFRSADGVAHSIQIVWPTTCYCPAAQYWVSTT